MAPGMRAARYPPCSTGTIMSSVRCITRVGTRIVGSTWRTSISPLNRYQAIADPGLARVPLQARIPAAERGIVGRVGAKARAATRMASPPLLEHLQDPFVLGKRVAGGVVGRRRAAAERSRSTRSADTRCGNVAANSMHVGPPSAPPSKTACSMPASSITARMSSMASSGRGTVVQRSVSGSVHCSTMRSTSSGDGHAADHAVGDSGTQSGYV